MVKQFIHNGKIFKTDAATLNISSRGLRFGEGFFETMRSEKGVIQLKNLHFERIEKTMKLLGFEFSRLINMDSIELKINQLLIKNNDLENGRIRLMFFRRKGGLYDSVSTIPEYSIETFKIEKPSLNSNGLILDYFEKALKPCDEYANLKSNNFLPYVMGAKFAEENQLNDAIIFNTNGNICDTTIANIFIIKNGIVSTPSLSEGCIAGVMRQHILSTLKNKYELNETSIKKEDVEDADEVFITNAIKGIRWVKSIENKTYGNKTTKEIYRYIEKTI